MGQHGGHAHREVETDDESRGDRPEPAGYFLDAGEGIGLLEWNSIVEKLSKALNYWVGTTRPDGRPHSMPVWGVWLDGAFYFSTSPQSRKARNLAIDPAVVVHLESGDEVVVLEGSAEPVTDDARLESFRDAYNPKYEWDFTIEQLQRGGVFAVRPVVAFAWLGSRGESFSGAATRWQFSDS